MAEFTTFYRIVSVATHAGSSNLGRSYEQLLNQERPQDDELVKVLLTALNMNLRIQNIVSSIFPEQIKLEELAKAKKESDNLVESLMKTQT